MNITLTGSAGTLTFTDTDIVASNGVDIKKTHTGISDFQITLKGDRSIEDFAARQDLIKVEVSSGTEFIGYLTNVSHGIRQGNTTISGVGIGKRLEETRPDYESLGGSLTYSNISVQEALRDYWSRTPFANYTVYDQPLESVATNELVQSADTQTEWANVTPAFSDSTPIAVESGKLTPVQVAFTAEGEAAGGGNFTVTSNASYSGGQAAVLAFSNENLEVTFTPQIDIPEAQVGIYARWETLSSSGSPQLTFTLNNNSWEGAIDGASIPDLEWRDFANNPASTSNGYQGGALEAGTTYTLNIDATTDKAGGGAAFDVTAPLHTGYNYTFDNDNGGSSGYLDGPELFPQSVTGELNITPVSFNISSSNVDAVINNTANNQAVSVSNDGGTNYTTFNNTQTVDHAYTGAGREARLRFTLGRTDETRTTATPQTGYNAQAVDSFEHRVDGNNLAVIVNLELSKNHFENLQTLHDKGDFVWNIEHDDLAISNLVVESFRKGTQTKTLPVSKEIDSTPEISGGNYYNSIYLQGALVNGSRPVAEVKDEDRIAQDGREISPGVLRDLDVTTEGGAIYEANVLLSRATKNNALRGTKTYPADLSIQPGYSYSVSFQGDGTTQEFPLEELALRYTESEAQVQLDFVPRNSLAEDVSELKRNSRQQSDRL